MSETVPTSLEVKATASLQEEIDKELKVKDPDVKKAKAVLQPKESN